MSGTDGAKAALADLHEPPAQTSAEGRQMTFLSETAPAAGEPGSAERTGKAGRPKGARNRSTEEWRRHLLGRYSSPLEAVLKVATTSREALALEVFGVSFERLERDERLQLFDRRVRAAEAALPYLHQKQPQALDLGDGSQPLAFVVVPAGATAEGEQGVVNLLAGDYAEVEDDEPESDDISSD